MGEPADVGLEEGAQVRHAVLQHGDAVDAQAFEIDDGARSDRVGIDVGRAQVLRGAEYVFMVRSPSGVTST